MNKPTYYILLLTCLVSINFGFIFGIYSLIKNHSTNIKELQAHDHKNLYTSHDYVDFKIGKDICSLKEILTHEFAYDLGSGNEMTTNEVIAEILNYLGIKLEYVPPEEIKARLDLKQSFSEQARRDGVD